MKENIDLPAKDLAKCLNKKITSVYQKRQTLRKKENNKDLPRTFYVYMHTNLYNNKKYIGITCTRPNIRWSNGNGYKRNVLFWRAICKYGWDGFQHDVLFSELSFEEAQKKEIELIAENKSNHRLFGYNLTAGGGGHLGYTCSDETRKKISMSLTGKTLTKEHRDNIKKSCRYGADNYMSKKVNQYKDGVLLNSYPSASEAGRQVGLDKSGIARACRGQQPGAGGYDWEYVA